MHHVLLLAALVKVIGYIQAPATLFPGKWFAVPNTQEVLCTPEPVLTL
jgi:hypothetical protein